MKQRKGRLAQRGEKRKKIRRHREMPGSGKFSRNVVPKGEKRGGQKKSENVGKTPFQGVGRH